MSLKRENASILYESDYKNTYDYDPNSPEGHIALSLVQNAFLEQSILFAESGGTSILKDFSRKKQRGKAGWFCGSKTHYDA